MVHWQKKKGVAHHADNLTTGRWMGERMFKQMLWSVGNISENRFPADAHIPGCSDVAWKQDFQLMLLMLGGLADASDAGCSVVIENRAPGCCS